MSMKTVRKDIIREALFCRKEYRAQAAKIKTLDHVVDRRIAMILQTHYKGRFEAYTYCLKVIREEG
jgi:hypothetical protein